MRKDMLLKEWLKKTGNAEENELTYEIKVGFMLNYDGDSWVLECFADLYIDGKIEEMHTIDFIESADEIEKVPASMKRKAKSFVEYFKAWGAFKHNISYNDKLITV